MPRRRSKVAVPVNKGMQILDAVQTGLMRTTSELLSNTDKLRRAHEWVPLMHAVSDGRKAKAALGLLHRRRSKLLKTLSSLDRRRSARQSRIMPKAPHLHHDPGNSEQEEGPLLTKEGLLEFLRAREQHRNRGLYIEYGEREWPCSGTSQIVRGYEHVECESVVWSEDSAWTDHVWNFSYWPDAQTDRAILQFNSLVAADCPEVFGEITDVKRASLTISAIVPFEIPAPKCDSALKYQARTQIDVPVFVAAVGQASFSVYVLLYEQADASSVPPHDLADFEWLDGDAVFNDNGFHHLRRDVHISGEFQVKKDVPSRLYIGVVAMMTVECGVSRVDIFGGLGKLVFFPPPGENVWGLKVITVPE